MAYQVANRKCGINLKMIVEVPNLEVPNLVAIRYDNTLFVIRLQSILFRGFRSLKN